MKGRDQAPQSPEEFQNPGTGGTVDPRGGAASSAPSHGNRGESSGIGSTGIGSPGAFSRPGFSRGAAGAASPFIFSFSRDRPDRLDRSAGKFRREAPGAAGIPPSGFQPRSLPPLPAHPLVPPRGFVVQQRLSRRLDRHGFVPARPIPAFGAVPLPPIPGKRRKKKMGSGMGTPTGMGSPTERGQGTPRIPHLCLRELREWPDL